MYTFSSKLKTFSLILMVVGILGIGYGFLTAPKTIEDVKKIEAASHHEGGHEAAGHEAHAAAAVTPEAHQEGAAEHQQATTAEATSTEAVKGQESDTTQVDRKSVV